MLRQPYQTGTDLGPLDPRIVSLALKMIIQQCVVIRNKSVPTGIGYGSDAKVFEIDKDMPQGFFKGQRLVLTDQFLLLQGVIERALLDQYNLPLYFVGQIAREVVKMAVENANVSWNDYLIFMRSWIRWIEAGKPAQPPTTVSYVPYFGGPTNKTKAAFNT